VAKPVKKLLNLASIKVPESESRVRWNPRFFCAHFPRLFLTILSSIILVARAVYYAIMDKKLYPCKTLDYRGTVCGFFLNMLRKVTGFGIF